MNEGFVIELFPYANDQKGPKIISNGSNFISSSKFSNLQTVNPCSLRYTLNWCTKIGVGIPLEVENYFSSIATGNFLAKDSFFRCGFTRSNEHETFMLSS